MTVGMKRFPWLRNWSNPKTALIRTLKLDHLVQGNASNRYKNQITFKTLLFPFSLDLPHNSHELQHVLLAVLNSRLSTHVPNVNDRAEQAASS